MNESYDLRSARKTFSVTGFALIAVLITGTVLQMLFLILPPAIWGADNWLSSSSTGFWIITFLPIHGVAIPLGVLIMRSLPCAAPEKTKLGVRGFLSWIPVCFFLMYSGSIIGNIFSMLASGGQAQNALMEIAMDSNPMKILVIVILAPCLEELIFRKAVIDHTRQYGEKWAVVLSGLLFALFHMNFFQFFYAFLLGALLAYIYIRTGRFSYVAILHCIVNFVGSVVAPWVLSLLDVEALDALSTGLVDGQDPVAAASAAMAFFSENLLGLVAYSAFMSFIVAMFVWGLVLFIIKVRRLKWTEAEAQLPNRKGFRTVYLNVGIILFVLLSLGLSFANLFA